MTILTVECYALRNPQGWQGATQEPHQLPALRTNDLQVLVNSRLSVTAIPGADGKRFAVRQLLGERCQFTVNGETKLVDLAFDAISPQAGSRTQPAFWIYAQGSEAKTEKPTWGAIHGPFKLVKMHDFSAALASRIN